MLRHRWINLIKSGAHCDCPRSSTTHPVFGLKQALNPQGSSRTSYVCGVYTDWSDCKAQVDHHKGNSYKAFKSDVEAYDFISQNQKRAANDQAFTDSQPAAQGYTGTKGHAGNQTYPATQGYSGQGYGGQGYSGQGYGNQGYGSSGYAYGSYK